MEQIGHDPDFQKFMGKMYDHARECHEFADILSKSHLAPARVERMRHCSTFTQGTYCPKCKAYHVTQYSKCRDRLCPNCGWALARERSARVILTADEMLSRHPDMEAVHMVLTIKHTDGAADLGENIDRIILGFRLLMRSKSFKPYIYGYVRNIEILNDAGGFHPHLHAVLFVKPEYWDNMVSQDTLCHIWRRCIKADYLPVTWIEKAHKNPGKVGYSDYDEAIFEAVKYAIKTQQLRNLSPADLDMVAEAVTGKHLYQVGGGEFSTLYHQTASISKTPFGEDAINGRCKWCGTDVREIVVQFDDNLAPKVYNVRPKHKTPIIKEV